METALWLIFAVISAYGAFGLGHLSRIEGILDERLKRMESELIGIRAGIDQ